VHGTGITRRRFLTNTSLAAMSVYGGGLLRAQTSNTTVVPTPSGVLRGSSENGVRVFRGVPFAEPPVGPLRFRKPVPVKPVPIKSGTGERDATHFAAAAMQPGEAKIAQSEDCLYLNVWAPEGKGPYPVFVWIHGGGFTGGQSFAPIFDGAEFASEGIVVITVAYRLGVFGFLDMEPLLGSQYAGSANNALRDLIAALTWVKHNVAAFGGDPARVTVGGESAGAKLADILMGVPEAQGLFHSVISESGGAERIWAASNAAVVAKGFGDAWAKARSETPAGLLTDPADALIKLQQSFTATWPQHFPLRCELDGSLISRLPIETIAAGSTRGKRLLIGTNRDESALFVGPHPAHDATPGDLGNVAVEKFAPVYAKYKALYPEMNDEQRRIRALTAEEYWIPSMRVVDAHVEGGGAAWMYRLDFAPSSGRYKGDAYHSEDLGLVWDKPNRDIDNAEDEARLAKQIHAAWVSFIRGSTPASAGLPSWPAYRSDTRPTMVLDAQSRVETKPNEAELRLWDGVL